MSKYTLTMRQASVNLYTAEVEADSEDEARALAEAGEVEWKFENNGESGLCYQCDSLCEIEIESGPTDTKSEANDER